MDQYLNSTPGRPDGENYPAAYRRLFTLAMRAAWRISGDRTFSEDAAAEALARAYVSWDKLGDPSYQEAWVQRVAANLAIDETRRLRRIPPATADHADRTESSAAALDLAAALRKLTRRQREAVVLHHLLDLPVDVVAAQLGLSEGAVSSHLHRGVSKLRAALASEGAHHV